MVGRPDVGELLVIEEYELPHVAAGIANRSIAGRVLQTGTTNAKCSGQRF